ncbi:MAG: hypothetical protein KAS12_00405 [Candidatus Aenigmarchaeota archaeon]|nr:hypothetical protein [Candidatus Aenigmarchaeota archaeon]
MDFIYAFKPFFEEPDNISEKIALRLDSQAHILPVVFDSAELLGQIKTLKPTRIIGIGRCRHGKLVRIERKANNIIEGLKKINPSGMDNYFSTLKLKTIVGSRKSYNMGDYVCNYMHYSILEFLKKNNLDIPTVFFHVPMTMDLDEAVGVLKKLLK